MYFYASNSSEAKTTSNVELTKVESEVISEVDELPSNSNLISSGLYSPNTPITSFVQSSICISNDTANSHQHAFQTRDRPATYYARVTTLQKNQNKQKSR